MSSCGFLIWSRASLRLSRGGLFKMSAGFSLLAFMAFAFKEKKKRSFPVSPCPRVSLGPGFAGFTLTSALCWTQVKSLADDVSF